jgi:hypothetical protein
MSLSCKILFVFSSCQDVSPSELLKIENRAFLDGKGKSNLNFDTKSNVCEPRLVIKRTKENEVTLNKRKSLRKSVIDEIRARVLVPYKRAVILLSIVSIISIIVLIGLIIAFRIVKLKTSSNNDDSDNNRVINNISIYIFLLLIYKK